MIGLPGSKYHALLAPGYPFNPHDADLGEREGGREEDDIE